jgi:hypothetical protein
MKQSKEARVRKSIRRATLVLALTPLVSSPMVMSALAATGGTDPTTTVTTTPAPPGDATASAVDIDGILTIGKTSAHAGSDGAKSSATALAIGGQTVSGGDNGTGNLVGTGTTPLGDAEVAPWSASHSGDSATGYKSNAEAALAHLNFADVLQIWLFHSKSSATWTQDKSTGDSESDGAELNLADALDVKVLHSEAHSGGQGKSDLLVINGNEIGSSDQADGQCDIDAEPLLHLLCLTASGGTSSTGVTTSGGTVIKVDVGNGQLGGVVSDSSSQGGLAPSPQQPTVQHHKKPASSGQTSGSRVPNAGPQAGGLPFTGSDVERMGALGVALAALGGLMTAFARRRRGAFAA